MNIYEKIYQVMQDIQYLQKDGFVETGKKDGKATGYKAMTDEKVTSTLRPALLKARLVILPVYMETTRTDEDVTDKFGNMKKNRITDCRVSYRIFDIDNPSDFVDVVSAGTGVDTQDKGIGKAMTYARKYMLLNTFLIPTGNDTDDISSDMYDEKLYGTSEQPAEIPNASADTLRKEIFVIAAAKGFTEEQMTANPYKKYGNKMFADLTVDELRDLKRTIAARKDK